MHSNELTAGPSKTRCEQCDAEFECGAHTETCWCMHYPPLEPAESEGITQCLCPSCLTRRLQEKVSRKRATLGT